MRQFKDNNGLEWLVTFDIAAVKRIRDLAGANLLDTRDPDLFTRLARDLLLFMDALWAVCMPQAGKRNQTAAEFFAAVEGDVIDAARTAFWEELADFFRRLGMPGHAAALEKVAEALQLTNAATVEYLSTVDLGKRTAEIFGALSSNAPGPPG